MNSRGQPRTTAEWLAVLKERDELKSKVVLLEGKIEVRNTMLAEVNLMLDDALEQLRKPHEA